VSKSVLWCQTLVDIPGVAKRDYETETAFQIYCADWLRKQYELTGDKRYANWHHSANERIGAKSGFLAKMMGQGKGWPDFVQPLGKLAVELKVLGGAVSADQTKWLEHFRSIGWKAEIVRTFEQFKEIVESA
jgi:hypothetical protein